MNASPKHLPNRKHTSDPAVSVIMPCWNGERYLEIAVHSILNQSFENFELLLIDDGSTDSTPDIIQALAKKDPRIIPHAGEHAGLVAALNMGLRLSKAPLIARMDSDDIARPTRLAKQVAAFADHPNLVLLGTQAQLIGPEGQSKRKLHVPTNNAELQKALATSCPFIHPSVMFRREAVDKSGAYNELYRHAEDYDLWLRMAGIGDIANLHEDLLQYRIHGANISQTHSNAQALATAMAFEAFSARNQNQSDPMEQFSAMPTSLSDILKTPGIDKQRVCLTYQRSMVYSGALQSPEAAANFFAYLKTAPQHSQSNAQNQAFADVLIRAVAQFFRHRQFSNALKTIAWVTTAIPKQGLAALYRALKLRLAT